MTRSINRKTGLVLLLIFIIGAPLAFSQEVFDLPEPVFINAVAQKGPAAIGFDLRLPAFEEVVYYLWNFNAFDNTDTIEFLSSASLAQAAQTDASIPSNIRNNTYFIQSVQFTNRAQEAFEDGDYDASKAYSEEAIKYALLSDEYVRLQLKIKEADDLIAQARARLEWANSSAVDAARRYPNEYAQAQNALNEAQNLRARENWDEAIAAANRVMISLGAVAEAPAATPGTTGTTTPGATVVTTPSAYPLPAQYTVRAWAISKDCFWNIAGRPWVYNDPNQWRLLYNANRSKLPQPDNPDLIHPGMVLDIPSIRGETREGMWVDGRTYVPLR